MRVYLTLQDRVFTSHCAPRLADGKVIVTHHTPGHIPSPLLGAIGAAPIMGIGRSREIFAVTEEGGARMSGTWCGPCMHVGADSDELRCLAKQAGRPL